MKKTPRTATVALAALLVVGSVFAGGAFAKQVIQPSVSLSATFSDNVHGPGKNDDGILATGVYDNVSHACQGPSGRPVYLSVSNGYTASGHTKGGGSYRKLMGPFRHGTYTVNVTVPGSVRGGYGATVVCNDASNSASVKVDD